jgi:nucleoside-diphosphate-sugar epimerase
MEVQMTNELVALVAGANGIIGDALMRELGKTPSVVARALSRSPNGAGRETIVADLSDAEATARAVQSAADTTHVFYAALLPNPSLAEEDRRNTAMLRNLLDGLKAAGAPLKRVVLYQGGKVYGVHLGKVIAPFYEDDPIRVMGPHFYYSQEDLLRAGAAAGEYEWSILRPDVVIGDVYGNAMNIAMVIGVYAAICRATNTPFRFPGKHGVYTDVFHQFTEAGALARASLWAATASAAKNEAFNYVHEPIRWQRLWTKVGDALGLRSAPPVPLRLVEQMADKADIWRRIVSEHGLSDIPYAQLVGWGFGDGVLNTEWDMVSDMGKIRRAGFTETVDTAEAMLDAIASLSQKRVLPFRELAEKRSKTRAGANTGLR